MIAPETGALRGVLCLVEVNMFKVLIHDIMKKLPLFYPVFKNFVGGGM